MWEYTWCRIGETSDIALRQPCTAPGSEVQKWERLRDCVLDLATLRTRPWVDNTETTVLPFSKEKKKNQGKNAFWAFFLGHFKFHTGEVSEMFGQNVGYKPA